MNYFLRALRDASKSWPLLVAAFLCSAGVAGLWGANIAALFPVIEVTLNGESLQTWNEKRIADAQIKLENNGREIQQLRDRLAGGGTSEAEQQSIQNKINTLTLEDKGDKALLASARALQPWIKNYLPNDPFETVLVVVVLIVVSTFLKHCLLLTSTMLVSFVAMGISRDLRVRIFNKALELDRSTVHEPRFCWLYGSGNAHSRNAFKRDYNYFWWGNY